MSETNSTIDWLYAPGAYQSQDLQAKIADIDFDEENQCPGIDWMYAREAYPGDCSPTESLLRTRSCLLQVSKTFEGSGKCPEHGTTADWMHNWLDDDLGDDCLLKSLERVSKSGVESFEEGLKAALAKMNAVDCANCKQILAMVNLVLQDRGEGSGQSARDGGGSFGP